MNTDPQSPANSRDRLEFTVTQTLEYLMKEGIIPQQDISALSYEEKFALARQYRAFDDGVDDTKSNANFQKNFRNALRLVREVRQSLED